MSRHAIPAGTDIRALAARLAGAGRPPAGWVQGDGPQAPPTEVEFDPDLSAGEQAALAGFLALAGGGAQDSADLPALLQALLDDRATLLGAGALTVAQLRPLIARTDAALLLLARYLRRQGL